MNKGGKRAIRNVSQIRGVWGFRYELPPGADGKRRQRRRSCPGMSQAQAELAHQNFLLDQRLGKGVVDESKKTVEILMAKYLQLARPKLARKTWERYSDYARLNIIPRFGATLLSKLKPLHIEEWYSELLESGIADGRGGLSPKSVRNIHGFFHKALEDGVKWQMLNFNPLDKVEQPKVPHREMQTANAAQLAVLREALQGTPYLLPFEIYLGTGIRRGELCGLQWGDMDFEHNTVAIRRSIEQIGTDAQPKDPKTGKARVIPMPPSLVELLRREQAVSKAKWVCVNSSGTMLKPNYLGHCWTRMKKRAGVTITMHELRHTYATELINRGVPGKAVQQLLGHSSMSTTMNIYAHVLQSSLDKAAEVVESAFFGQCVTNVSQPVESEENRG